MCYTVQGSLPAVAREEAKGQRQTPGTEDYLVLMFCPALQATTRGASRFGGFSALQTSDTSTIISVPRMFNNTIGFDMQDICGGDCTSFGAEGFSFSQKLSLVLEGPNATTSGVIFKGAITFGALREAGTVTVEQLLQISRKSRLNNKKVTLQSSVIDTSIGSGLWSESYVSFAQHLESEIIDFAVIHKPFQNINDGTNIPYAIDFQSSGNIVFKPKLASPLSFNLYQKFSVPHAAGTPHDTPYDPSYGQYEESWLTPGRVAGFIKMAHSLMPKNRYLSAASYLFT